MRASRLSMLAGLMLHASPALADSSLAVCLSHETAAVIASGTATALDGNVRVGGYLPQLATHAEAWLRALGAGIERSPARASMVLRLTLDAQETRLDNPLLGGDQYPLRSVQLSLAAVVDGRGAPTLGEANWEPVVLARNSTKEAVAEYVRMYLDQALTETMRKACDSRPQMPIPMQAAKPAPVRAAAKPVDPKELDRKVQEYKLLCMSAGERTDMEARGKLEGVLELLKRNAQVKAGADGAVTKKWVEGVMLGTDDKLNAEQADKVRECLRPLRRWMEKTYFGAGG